MKKMASIAAAATAAVSVAGVAGVAAPAGAGTIFPECNGNTWQTAAHIIKTTSWNCWTRGYSGSTVIAGPVRPGPGVELTIYAPVPYLFTDWTTKP